MKSILIVGIILCSSVAFSAPVVQSGVIEKTDFVFSDSISVSPITLSVIDLNDFELSSVAVLAEFNPVFVSVKNYGEKHSFYNAFEAVVMIKNKGDPLGV